MQLYNYIIQFLHTDCYIIQSYAEYISSNILYVFCIFLCELTPTWLEKVRQKRLFKKYIINLNNYACCASFACDFPRYSLFSKYA